MDEVGGVLLDDDNADDSDDDTIYVRLICHAFLAAAQQHPADEQQQQQQQRRRRRPFFKVNFYNLTFKREDARFVVAFVLQNKRYIPGVAFLDCRFEDETTVNTLKNGFATEALSGVEVLVSFAGIQSLSYFPSTVELATHLDLSVCQLGNDGFRSVVDTTLRGSGKQRLESLYVDANDLSSECLADVTRLVQQSKLRTLKMEENKYLLQNRAQFQAFCEDGLKKAKYINTLWLAAVDNRSTANTSLTEVDAAVMIANVLTVNTSLTEVCFHRHMGHEARAIMECRVNPLFQRNIQMSKVQSILDRTRENLVVTTPGEVWFHMGQNTTFLDSPDLSALYLALRNVTVGRQGEASDLLVVPVAGVLAEQERRAQKGAMRDNILLRARITSLSRQNGYLHDQVFSLRDQRQSERCAVVLVCLMALAAILWHFSSAVVGSTFIRIGNAADVVLKILTSFVSFLRRTTEDGVCLS